MNPKSKCTRYIPSANSMDLKIDETIFWEIVDKSIGNADSNPIANANSDQTMAVELLKIIYIYPPNEIAAFEGYLQRYKAMAYKKELYGAAQLLNGTTLSDDGYDGFTNWLITRGKKAYMGALQNADSLVKQTTKASGKEGIDTFYGDFCSVPYLLYKKLTGKKMPFDHESYGNPPDPHAMTGYPLTIEELQAEYPLLWKRFGKLYLKNAEAEKNYQPGKSKLDKLRAKQEKENEALSNEIREKIGHVPNEELYELERKRLKKLYKDAMERDPKATRLTEKEIDEKVQILMDGGAYYWIYDDRSDHKSD